MLAEPGAPHRRGSGQAPGLLHAEFGDRPAREITTRDVARFLRRLDEDGASAWTVNKHRQVICASFNYGMRDDTFALARNPGAGSNKRREPPPSVLDFYEPDDVELIARAAARGSHRWVARFLAETEAGRPVELAGRIAHVPLVAVVAETEVNPAFAAQLAETADATDAVAYADPEVRNRSSFDAEETAARQREDQQDADLYRIAAYTGLRLGELRALHWGDVDLTTRRVVVHRALSGRVQGPTKSWQTRYVPIADPAAGAFRRLAERVEYTSADDLVFCSRFGRRLDAAAIRRRFKRASSAVGLRVLRFHALRHGAGSLIARQAEPRWVQGFLGHSKLSTTERYLHAKARPEEVALLNRAFGDAGTPNAGKP
jgi:integrase